jgi:hypothetical protein
MYLYGDIALVWCLKLLFGWQLAVVAVQPVNRCCWLKLHMYVVMCIALLLLCFV